MFLTGTDITAG